MNLRHFEQENILHLVISDEPESRSVELNDDNKMIGVEILNASESVLDLLQEFLQASVGKGS